MSEAPARQREHSAVHTALRHARCHSGEQGQARQNLRYQEGGHCLCVWAVKLPGWLERNFSELLDPDSRSKRADINFGVQLMDLFMGEVVDKGEAITGHRDGARYQGKYLEHVSYRLTRESLLSNPTLLNLVRQHQSDN